MGYPSSTSVGTASGGKPGYSFSISGDALPSWLTQGTGTDTDKLIATGTPDTADDYTFEVAVTDSNDETATGNVILKIVDALAFTPATLPDGQVGAAYPDTSAGTASGGKPNYTFSISSGAVPLGMWLEADGTLRGTPDASAVGHHSFEVTVTDDEGYTAAESLALTIAPAPPPPAASIPTLPAPLLPALMAALGLMGAAAAGRRMR